MTPKMFDWKYVKIDLIFYSTIYRRDVNDSKRETILLMRCCTEIFILFFFLGGGKNFLMHCFSKRTFKMSIV